MASEEAIHLSPTTSLASISQESEAVGCSSTLGSTRRATESMDGRGPRDAGGLFLASPSSKGHVVPDAGQNMAPASPDNESSCMALEGRHLLSFGQEGQVVDTLLVSRAPSTQLLYSK